MIQKRNISTFAIGLCLLALMLLSASKANAFLFVGTSIAAAANAANIKKNVYCQQRNNDVIEAAFNSCLRNTKSHKKKTTKRCFEKFRDEHMICLTNPFIK